MKHIMIRFVSVILLVLLIAYVMGLSWKLIVSPAYLGIMLIGTGIMALLERKGECDREHLRYKVGEQALWISFVISFLAIFAKLSEPIDGEKIRQEILLCMRPVFYGLCTRLILGGEAEGRKTEEQKEVVEKQVQTKEIKAVLEESGLSKREQEVALLLFDNLSNQEIAEKLFLAENTVKKHNANLYKKMGVTNREQLKQEIMSKQ